MRDTGHCLPTTARPFKHDGSVCGECFLHLLINEPRTVLPPENYSRIHAHQPIRILADFLGRGMQTF